MFDWHAYRIILRLHTPLHIGWGKVSYLQRTRPYVTGRVLRGALVNRVGRNGNIRGKNPLDPFRCVSKTFAQYLTFTYFYPALKDNGGWKAHFFWEDEAAFRRRFLSSYGGTALEYPQQSAAEGLLREIEFISPYTLDTGEPVYLMGYIFVDECCEKYDWQGALKRIQLGGERGYGWGEAQAEVIERLEPGNGRLNLFGQEVGFDGSEKPPRLKLAKNARVWAHVWVTGAGSVSGAVEPLVGREWRADNRDQNQKPHRQHIGQHLSSNGVCYLPGSLVKEAADFLIGKGGIWQQAAS